MTRCFKYPWVTLFKPSLTLSRFLFYYHFTNSSSNSTMSFKPKMSKKKHSPEIILVILIFHNLGKSLAQICNYIKVLWATVSYIIYWATWVPNNQLHLNKWVEWPLKLDACAQKALIYHVEQNLYDNLVLLGTPSKTEQTLDYKSVQSYLKNASYLWFKAPKKLFLT